ncbi:hypothetical protein MEO94_31665, partial [Dolichospermum sp. ST_sed9]|nr:hypothetical protein [Dolichospermum sp. ST_sed9]
IFDSVMYCKTLTILVNLLSKVIRGESQYLQKLIKKFAVDRTVNRQLLSSKQIILATIFLFLFDL